VQLLDHVDIVVVTHGAKGASLYRDGGRAQHLDAFPVERVVDPTGAGDALRAGWYAALQVGLGFDEALRWGQAAASIVVQHPGPQDHVLRPDELKRVLAA
jgi:adenosine kinase